MTEFGGFGSDHPNQGRPEPPRRTQNLPFKAPPATTTASGAPYPAIALEF
jgi:hypothetical protein